MTDSTAVHFSKVLKPYRSLPPEGFKWLIRAVIAANLLIGLPMYLLGAWPVVGFSGIDVMLIWWFFQRNYFDARRSETLTLTDSALIVSRVAPGGEREEIRLDAYWLKLEPSEERLVATSRGNRVLIGRFLAPSEREKVAEELKAALAELRAPTFIHRWDKED
ncbi:MAG: DUF2244 domain-containing protein [Alphaproteobacteria bacterium]|nr:DUF2244 domain-containing protein [Alphaproteobacteria bacterium]